MEKIVDDLVYDKDGNLIPRARCIRDNEGNCRIVDIADINTDTFFVDEKGIKHIQKYNENWQEVKCKWDDPLILDNGRWRVKTEEEILQDKKEEAISVIKEVFFKEILSIYPTQKQVKDIMKGISHITLLLFIYKQNDEEVSLFDIIEKIINKCIEVINSVGLSEENIEKIDDSLVESVLIDVESISAKIGEMEINSKELMKEIIKTYSRMFLVIIGKKKAEKTVGDILNATSVEEVQSILERMENNTPMETSEP